MERIEARGEIDAELAQRMRSSKYAPKLTGVDGAKRVTFARIDVDAEKHKGPVEEWIHELTKRASVPVDWYQGFDSDHPSCVKVYCNGGDVDVAMRWLRCLLPTLQSVVPGAEAYRLTAVAAVGADAPPLDALELRARIRETEGMRPELVQALRNASDRTLGGYRVVQADATKQLLSVRGVRSAAMETWCVELERDADAAVHWRIRNDCDGGVVVCRSGDQVSVWRAIGRLVRSLDEAYPEVRFEILDTATRMPLPRIETVREADYDGEQVYWNGRYFDTCDELREWCLDNDREPPRRVQACDEVRMKLDAEEIIQRELEDQESDDDAFDRVDDAGVVAMQAFFDAWCDEHAPVWYEPDDGREVLLDPAEWERAKR